MEARKVCLYSLVPLLLLMLCLPAHAIIYVSKSGNDANSGLSWATSKLTIQAGVTTAAASADPTVWVAVGTLPPPDLPAQPAPIAYPENVVVPDKVAVYGGFRGGETASSPPPPRSLSTIVIPGDITNPIFALGSCDTIDGFTIEGGSADTGAGILVLGSSAIISNNLIRDNVARLGAGVCAVDAALQIINCQFEDNTATDTSGTLSAGGGVFAIGGSLIVFRTIFAGQQAVAIMGTGHSAQGGAIYSTGATLVRLDACVFEECAAVGATESTFGVGGAICVIGATTNITNSLFHACIAYGAGAPEPAIGGAIYYEDSSTIAITNNTFVENGVVPHAGSISESDRPYGLGGAVYLTGAGSQAKILNNIIAGTRGTAVVSKGTIVTFNYNLLWHNAGGDIYGFSFPVQNPPSSTDNNIMRDPQFLLGDPFFHITYGSPAKNAGSNSGSISTDIDGETRPFNAVVDIGADEFVDSDNDGGADTDPREVTPGTIEPPEADADGDGIYTPYDNCPGVPNPSQVDSNGDGIGDVCQGIPEVIYVDAGAAPGGDGLSWATAYQTIQQGINAADLHNQTNVDGATSWPGVNPQVWVREGAYSENILIWHGVAVYGGFTGSESPPSVDPDVLSGRTPLANPSVIAGGFLFSTAVIAHLPQDRYLTGAVKTAYDNLATTIDGFTIVLGTAEIGGGVSVYKEFANISSNVIGMNNAALGGGVYFFKSHGTVGDGIGPPPGNVLTGDTAIVENIATGPISYAGFGGGVYTEQGGPLVFANIIASNQAYFGGGIASRKSAPQIVENLIGCETDPNVAAVPGGSGLGGGVYLDQKSWAGFEKDTIVTNFALGAASQGGGLWFSDSDFYMNLTIMAGNGAASGQEIWGNSPNAQVVLFPRCFITYSDFWPPVPSEFVGIPDPTVNGLPTDPCPTTTNGAVDPMFVDPANCNYNLQAGSPLRLPWGEVVGAFQDVDPPVTIAEAKSIANGVTVEISEGIVTAVFPDGFYIENSARTSAIKIILHEAPVAEGQSVTVTGVVTTLNDEKQIINAKVSVTASGSTAVVAPLGMPNVVVGSASSLPGLTLGIGLDNVGLLVKTWGKVIARGTSPYPYFTIDDGSGVGVKVRAISASALPEVGKSVVVTGISGVETDATGKRTRLLRIRRAADLTIPQ